MSRFCSWKSHQRWISLLLTELVVFYALEGALGHKAHRHWLVYFQTFVGIQGALSRTKQSDKTNCIQYININSQPQLQRVKKHSIRVKKTKNSQRLNDGARVKNRLSETLNETIAC